MFVGVAELVYAQVSEACAARLEGSNPSSDTIKSQHHLHNLRELRSSVVVIPR